MKPNQPPFPTQNFSKPTNQNPSSFEHEYISLKQKDYLTLAPNTFNYNTQTKPIPNNAQSHTQNKPFQPHANSNIQYHANNQFQENNPFSANNNQFQPNQQFQAPGPFQKRQNDSCFRSDTGPFDRTMWPGDRPKFDNLGRVSVLAKKYNVYEDEQTLFNLVQQQELEFSKSSSVGPGFRLTYTEFGDLPHIDEYPLALQE